ncbi:MAG TPA: ketoacyl-ACP synthase III [Thermoguttaceae bacterium]|nr:ketoacyl-ACP synthase III [Thermoguttaceae bacterium]
MSDARVLGISYHLPPTVETLEDLKRQYPEWPLEKTFEESGIRSRHIAPPGVTATDLGFEAALKLLRRELVSAEEIDFLIFCTQMPDHFLPSGACLVQHRLGLRKQVGAVGMDLGCSGFVYGLALSKALIVSGMAENVLLVVADTVTQAVHPRDRTTRVLFGDGAAAALVGATDSGPGRIGQFVVGTDGKGAASLTIPAGAFRTPRSQETAKEQTDDAGCTRSANHLFMDGTAVFTFAITVVPRVIRELLQSANLRAEDIDYYVYHQANKFMLEQLAHRSKVPPNKLALAMEDVGNTSSASIPITIQKYVEQRKIVAGSRLVLVGFGVGFSWAACEMTWG